MPGGRRGTSRIRRKLPHLHGGSLGGLGGLGGLGRGPLLGARRPIWDLFRVGDGKASYFFQRERTTNPDVSPHLLLSGATLARTRCPEAAVGPPALIGSCRICTAGAPAALAGDRSSAPGGLFSMVPHHG